MTATPFPDLKILANVETVEAVGQNLEDAVRFRLGSLVGTHDAAAFPVAGSIDCQFVIGDGTVNDILEGMLEALCKTFNAFLEPIFRLIIDIFEAIRFSLAGLIDSIVSKIATMLTTVTAALSAAVTAIANKMQEVVSAIVTTLTSLIDTITAKVREIVNSIQDIISAVFARIGVVVDSILQRISDGFNALLSVAAQVWDRISGGISTVVQTLLDVLLATLQRIGTGISQIVGPLVGAAETGLAKVRAVIEDIPTTLREMATDLQEFAGGVIGAPLAGMGDIFITQVEAFFDNMIDRLDLSPETIVRGFLTDLGLQGGEAERFATAAGKAMPRTPLIFVVALALMVPFILPPLVHTVMSPILEEVKQEVAQRVTPTLIPPGETLDAFLRGNIDQDRMRKELGEAGFSNERMDILLRSSRRLLDLGELFRWWLRGFITEDELDAFMSMQRIDPTDVERLKLAAFPLPPVGDLIRMAVREVFSPDIRTRFGQDEGFPEEFATFGAEQGISEFWAKAYWAAHWMLPSAQQGFEMLHRKVIAPDDLQLLLRALDVMPFWREKLTAIAFNPLTRVDVRRMHRLGLLSEDDLQTRYEDLGFDPDNADMMKQFTVAFNADDASEAELEIEGLTRSTVVNMFEDGILDESEALDILGVMGLSETVAGLFIEQRKLEVERRGRSALIENIIRLVGGGVINFPEAQDSLAQLGLTATELAIAAKRILAARGGRSRLPTPAQLDKMLALEIIDQELWVETMGGLGFPEEWVERIATLNVAAGQA